MADVGYKTYSFKAVGETIMEAAQTARTDAAQPTPIGIKTPVELGTASGDGLFSMHYDVAKNVADNLKNLILTNHGERLGLYDFGGNLSGLSYELANDNFDSMAMTQITTAVTKYMPYVKLQEFGTTILHNDEASGMASVAIRVTYTISGIGSAGTQAIEVIIAAAG